MLSASFIRNFSSCVIARVCIGAFRKMSTASNNEFNLGLIQMCVCDSKTDNFANARKLISEAVYNGGANIVALPECFNSPYGIKYFSEYAEEIPGETSAFLGDVAKEHKIYLIGGSFPERENAKLYNTCLVYNPEGEVIGKFRKLHLFDIDVPGKITFQESKALSSGNKLCFFDTQFCKVGIGICYDMRFPELSLLYAKEGCKLLVYPGAFNMTTGPAHWELLQRARAVDNQVYVAAVSPARQETSSYVVWGHSTVVDPWGTVAATIDQNEGVVIAKIDLNHLENVRKQIPTSVQKRNDIYGVISKI